MFKGYGSENGLIEEGHKWRVNIGGGPRRGNLRREGITNVGVWAAWLVPMTDSPNEHLCLLQGTDGGHSSLIEQSSHHHRLIPLQIIARASSLIIRTPGFPFWTLPVTECIP